MDAVSYFEENGFDEPDPADYGAGTRHPRPIGNWFGAAGTAGGPNGLILDGIVAGVGAVLGFVPQMLVLFLMLAFLEACGYMARIAFVLDRIFRKFGLSGKSFIPMLIGTGCGIPGVMASVPLKNERDRAHDDRDHHVHPAVRKCPFIAMVAGAIFGGAMGRHLPYLRYGCHHLRIMLKKTKMFSGDPALCAWSRLPTTGPTVGKQLRSMRERAGPSLSRPVHHPAFHHRCVVLPPRLGGRHVPDAL